MKYSDIKASVLEQFAVPGGFSVVPYITGCPGGGKSACVREIARALQERRGIPDSRVIEFNPSLRDPVDILGIPDTRGEYCRWLPPEEFYAIRAGQGPSVLFIEELSDASMAMQNPLCRVILDRCAGQLRLSEELYILATGNRTQDRSGANRLSTKLGNRMRELRFDTDLEDWCRWAAKHNISPEIVGFLRFRPALLSDFDPLRTVNPTPRSWEDASKIPTSLPEPVFYEHLAGSVGEGAAAEYAGFLKIYRSLPDMDEFLRNPSRAKIGKEPSVLFALCARISSVVSKENFPKFYKFFRTLPDEFCVMGVRECLLACPAIASTKAFMDFAERHQNALLGAD